MSLARSRKTFAGRFAMGELASAGGMGAIYSAEDTTTGERVAVKVLRDADEDDEGRFEREAVVLSELDHPHIVRYVAHGTTGDGERYIAMEWLEGEDLSARLERAPLRVSEAIDLGRAVASALAYAHERGVVHRDLKPSNLFLRDGEASAVKLIDFGVARGRLRAITRTGRAIGTPAYMAPEQARGGKDIDGRADLFSLGCVLYECLAGKAVFAGEHLVAILARVLFEEVAPLAVAAPGTPPELAVLVDSMISRARDDRPATALAVLAALDAISPSSVEAAVAARGDGGRRRPRTPALTTSEQRVVNIVLLGSREVVDPSDITLSVDEATGELEDLRRVARRHGGHLEAVAGGYCVATFAGSGEMTDRVKRAASCALALHVKRPAAPIALVTGRGSPTGGAGVTTGEVLERAAELLRAGPAPGVRIDQLTKDLLEDLFVVDVTPDSPILRRAGDSMGVRTLLGKRTSCVGRYREISAIASTFQACVEERAPRVALVTAPAGFGKSRLRYELLRELEASGEDVSIWIARAEAQGEPSPFGLIAQVIRRALDGSDRTTTATFAPASDPSTDAGRILDRVEEVMPRREAARIASVLAELATGPGLADGASETVSAESGLHDLTVLGYRIRQAVEDFVEAECATRPVVLVLEDLQWGDAATVGLVDALLGRLSTSPLFVLALARPEVREVFPNLWDERPFTEIRLAPLSARAAAELVREALGPRASAERVDRIVAQADGNAFHLEELIRAVAEGAGEELPPTLLAVAEARLDRVSPEARRVLRAGSVLGRRFWAGSIRALLGGGDALLPDLVARELVDRRPSSRVAGDEEYVFRHALIAEAAYASLTPEDRALGHRLAGAWLEKSGAVDPLELAEHFERGGEPVRASRWMRRAAEDALVAHAFAEALARAERGLAMHGAQEGDEVGRLALVAAQAERWLGSFQRAEARAREAMLGLERGSAGWLSAVEEAMVAAGRRGDYQLATAMASEIPRLTAADENRSALVTAACAAARQLLHAGRSDLSRKLLEDAERTAHDAPIEPWAQAEIARLRGAEARREGRIGDDLACYRAAVAAFERAGDARNAANARVSFAFACLVAGDVARARENLEEAARKAERLSATGIMTRAKQNLALVLAAEGKPDAARELLAQVVTESRAQGDVRFEAWTRVYEAELAARQWDWRAAEAAATRAIALLDPSSPARAGALAVLVEVDLVNQRVTEALERAREAMRIADHHGTIEEFDLRVRLAFVDAARAAGETALAYVVADDAVTRLNQRAATLADPADRALFLASSREHARLVEVREAVLAVKL